MYKGTIQKFDFGNVFWDFPETLSPLAVSRYKRSTTHGKSAFPLPQPPRREETVGNSPGVVQRDVLDVALPEMRRKISARITWELL